MDQPQLPQNVHRIEPDSPFTFDCSPDSRCFTRCCRQLELALGPYDVLRLCRATGLGSAELLDRYVIIEKLESDVFPRLYLTMVDDGQASCVFVTPSGCSVYRDRPGACRTYPMGRAVIREGETLSDFFVLLKETHCLGFSCKRSHTPRSYTDDQHLTPYNRFNDALAALIQHEQIRDGRVFTTEQLDLFILALYNLDSFKAQLISGTLSPIHGDDVQDLSTWDRERLLLYGIDWLQKSLFND